MARKTDTQLLLDYVILHELDLSEYREKLPKEIMGEFFVRCKNGCHTENQDCVAHLVDEIIEWENGKQYASLEKTLDDKFAIIEAAF